MCFSVFRLCLSTSVHRCLCALPALFYLMLCHGTGVESGNTLQYSYSENPMDKGMWWATIHRATNMWECTRVHAHTHTHTHENRDYHLDSTCGEAKVMETCLTFLTLYKLEVTELLRIIAWYLNSGICLESLARQLSISLLTWNSCMVVLMV